MSDSETSLIIYDTPPVFGDTLPMWERHLKKVRAWPASVENRDFAIRQAEEMIALKKAEASR